MGNGILLEIRDLHITFTQYDRGLKRRHLHPVRGLGCQVERGRLTAIVGASGSGKSLLAHAIMGILPYNCCMEGRIYYDGQLLDEKRLAALRGNEIALVPQGVSYLDPMMRVGQQIRGGRRDAAARETCRGLLERYGLGPETERLYPFQLSGGMARRVLIASALMGDPRLIIADEPTPGLDAHTARRVAGHFKELACEGAAVLLITHDLELALECADRILIFYEGNIIEEADPGDFREGKNLKEPYTQALYRAMPENGFHVWEEAGR
ncbi:ABC transporter ATP-binding protein [Clostridiaceae bacterium]|jgi:peptide/nickel transport system ATP-binding protein|nr:ABC transporter ATP-binding protein [Clostridiaceae bacterium]